MIQQITDAELEVMKIIWANGGTAYFAFIMDELAKLERTWQKNTVITLLSRLTEKQILRSRKIGRRNEYTAVVSADEYQAAQTRKFINKIYEGNVKGLVSNLIQSDILTPEEYEELRLFWERGMKER